MSVQIKRSRIARRYQQVEAAGHEDARAPPPSTHYVCAQCHASHCADGGDDATRRHGTFELLLTPPRSHPQPRTDTDPTRTDPRGHAPQAAIPFPTRPPCNDVGFTTKFGGTTRRPLVTARGGARAPTRKAHRQACRNGGVHEALPVLATYARSICAAAAPNSQQRVCFEPWARGHRPSPDPRPREQRRRHQGV
jgi:hypothetical protein